MHLLKPETKEILAKVVSGICKLPRIELAARTLGPTEVNFRQRGEIGFAYKVAASAVENGSNERLFPEKTKL